MGKRTKKYTAVGDFTVISDEHKSCHFRQGIFITSDEAVIAWLDVMLEGDFDFITSSDVSEGEKAPETPKLNVTVTGVGTSANRKVTPPVKTPLAEVKPEVKP